MSKLKYTFTAYKSTNSIHYLTIEVMKTYKVSKLNNGQHIVREVNANVYMLTFKGNKVSQLADLYTSSNECDCFVGHGTCHPINATFVETVELTF